MWLCLNYILNSVQQRRAILTVRLRVGRAWLLLLRPRLGELRAERGKSPEFGGHFPPLQGSRRPGAHGWCVLTYRRSVDIPTILSYHRQ